MVIDRRLVLDSSDRHKDHDLYKSLAACMTSLNSMLVGSMVDLVVLQIRGRVAVVGKAIGGGFTGRYDDRHFHGMVTRIELYQYVQDSDPCSR